METATIIKRNPPKISWSTIRNNLSNKKYVDRLSSLSEHEREYIYKNYFSTSSKYFRYTGNMTSMSILYNEISRVMTAAERHVYDNNIVFVTPFIDGSGIYVTGYKQQSDICLLQKVKKMIESQEKAKKKRKMKRDTAIKNSFSSKKEAQAYVSKIKRAFNI